MPLPAGLGRQLLAVGGERLHPLDVRAPVAAVEQQDLAGGAAAAHLLFDEPGGDRGGVRESRRVRTVVKKSRPRRP